MEFQNEFRERLKVKTLELYNLDQVEFTRKKILIIKNLRHAGSKLGPYECDWYTATILY